MTGVFGTSIGIVGVSVFILKLFFTGSNLKVGNQFRYG